MTLHIFWRVGFAFKGWTYSIVVSCCYGVNFQRFFDVYFFLTNFNAFSNSVRQRIEIVRWVRTTSPDISKYYDSLSPEVPAIITHIMEWFSGVRSTQKTLMNSEELFCRQCCCTVLRWLYSTVWQETCAHHVDTGTDMYWFKVLFPLFCVEGQPKIFPFGVILYWLDRKIFKIILKMSADFLRARRK